MAQRLAGQLTSGRDLPWWLVGTSLVATTFASDTPLVITGFVARQGIAGNWWWWCFAIGGMLTAFLLARLWRRAGIITEMELAELRYSGRPAAFLRGFRALFLGVPFNCLVIGWVNLGMATILSVTMGWDRLTAVMVSLAITGFYSALSGLWGVVATDVFQFVFAMGGTTALAWFVLRAPEVGGVAGLHAKLPESAFSFLPSLGDAPAALSLPLGTFLVYLGLQWWVTSFPGAEPGGGGYVAQRMMSAKDERHSFFATLWFMVAHYCIRPWPWILVALASITLYPGLANPEAGYAMAMRDFLPPGWRGALIAAFFAAYMSTIATQLNWGTSYVINDCYRRFLRPTASDAHYVWASRIATVVLALLGGLVTFVFGTIGQVWDFLTETMSGIGFVLLFRWYWWRINAWTEITAMVAPLLANAYLRLFTSVGPTYRLALIGAFTTLASIVVTFLTRPEPDEHLLAFYRRVRPGGPGWARIAALAGGRVPEPIGGLIVDALLGSVVIYGTLFGTGRWILYSFSSALPYFAAAGAATWLLYRDLTRRAQDERSDAACKDEPLPADRTA